MKRKFTLELPKLPKLNITSSKAPAKQDVVTTSPLPVEAANPSPPPSPDWPPVAPKSVRLLPDETLAELRLACLEVVRFNKPSHEYREEDYVKPVLDYANIRSATGGNNGAALRPASAPHRHGGSQFSYRPDVAVEDLFNEDNERPGRIDRSARLRVDQLMRADVAPDGTVNASVIADQPPSGVLSSRPATSSIPPQQGTADLRVKPASARSDSLGTTGSVFTAGSADPTRPYSTYSTAMTSAILTPAYSSNRASSQAAHCDAGMMKPDALNKLERQREKQKDGKDVQIAEDVTGGQAALLQDVARRELKSAVGVHAARVSSPRPRPADRRTSVFQSESTETESIIDSAKHGKALSAQVVRATLSNISSPRSTTRLPEGPTVTQLEDSKLSQPRRQSTSAAGLQRASSQRNKTDSVTNDILTHYTRVDSTSPAPSSVAAITNAAHVAPRPESRSSSRSRAFAHHVLDFFRPNYALRHRVSVDSGYGQAVDEPRRESWDVAPDKVAVAFATPGFTTEHKLQDLSRQMSRASTAMNSDQSAGLGMEASAPRPMVTHPAPSVAAAAQTFLARKPPINLNRELPPLPSLDSWRPDPEPPLEDPSTIGPPQAAIGPISSQTPPTLQPTLSLVSKFRLRDTPITITSTATYRTLHSSSAVQPTHFQGQPPTSQPSVPHPRAQSFDLPSPSTQNFTLSTGQRPPSHRPATHSVDLPSPRLLVGSSWRSQFANPQPQDISLAAENLAPRVVEGKARRWWRVGSRG